MNNWIECKKELPQVETRVLVWGYYTNLIYMAWLDSTSQGWILDSPSCLCRTQMAALDVTHWMPLPKPPEEKSLESMELEILKKNKDEYLKSLDERMSKDSEHTLVKVISESPFHQTLATVTFK